MKIGILILGVHSKLHRFRDGDAILIGRCSASRGNGRAHICAGREHADSKNAQAKKFHQKSAFWVKAGE
jgi:hypothetical protein